jgi:SAM-dependent methyltransferases
MSEILAEAYGDASVEIYDELIVPGTDPHNLELLLRFAGGGGRALELGPGTGRVAVPLASRGISVDGIESSQKMILKLRERERLVGNSRAIEIVGNDMRTFNTPPDYDLVFVLKHTLYLAPTLSDQKDVLRNVARSLKMNGAFVFEGIVPDPSRYEDGQCVRASLVTGDTVCLEASVYNRADQTLSSTEIFFYKGKIYLVPIRARYIWPSELDLIASSVGLELKERYSTWKGDTFSESSYNNISVYVKVREN